jgi:hypothetical protein
MGGDFFNETNGRFSATKPVWEGRSAKARWKMEGGRLQHFQLPPSTFNLETIFN